MILKHGLESMIVNILVYIEGREDVEGVAKIYFSWDRCITPKDWKEVCGISNMAKRLFQLFYLFSTYAFFFLINHSTFFLNPDQSMSSVMIGRYKKLRQNAILKAW